MALLMAPKSEATGAAAVKWKQGRLEDETEEDREEVGLSVMLVTAISQH
jgi:hypothetical protein